jgi:hypothetical protein
MESRKSTMDAITFQRRHYQFMAEILDNTRPAVSGEEMDRWERIALVFAGQLQNTNPGFDRARFLAACGME